MGSRLSGRLKDDLRLTAPTAEPRLMGLAVWRAEEENPCVHMYILPPLSSFPLPSLTYFSVSSNFFPDTLITTQGNSKLF